MVGVVVIATIGLTHVENQCLGELVGLRAELGARWLGGGMAVSLKSMAKAVLAAP